MQRSPMARRAAEEVPCSGSVVRGTGVSPVDRGRGTYVGRLCNARLGDRRTAELVDRYRQ